MRTREASKVTRGAMNSPQILLLSGIGPKEHLESVGVKVFVDLPGVGKNFHNHPGTPISLTIDEPDIYDNDWQAALQYLHHQNGRMSTTGTLSVVGMIATNMAKPDYPDITIHVNFYVASCAPHEIGALKSTGKRIFSMLAYYLHPKSRGSITLASNDPFEHPIIRANYLSDPHDLIKQVECLTKVLRSYNMTISGPIKACSEHKFLSNDYWACVAQHDYHSVYHFVGSCKMGPVDDHLAVVDPLLKVYGIEGLRVADASIMPQVPSCNAAAPTMMIGERAADFIKEYWA